MDEIDEPYRTIFDEANTIIYGDREKVYGDPGKNIRAIAGLWRAFIYAKHGQVVNIQEDDVCAMMRLLKEARLMNTPDHRDSLVDICGYAGVQERIHEKKQ